MDGGLEEVCSVVSGSSSGTARPVTINGITFLRVKGCPCCSVKNSDDNEIREGPLGVQHFPYTIWDKGTSINPKGLFDRLCVAAWLHGGFADKYPVLDVFKDELRKDRDLTSEFLAARTAVRKIFETERVRFNPTQADVLKSRLLETRRQVVKELKTKKEEIVTPYRMHCAVAYEKKYPGRIARKNMKVVEKFIDGVKRDVVLLRKLPHGQWDLNEKSAVGIHVEHIVDDGEHVICEGQAEAKYNARASMLRADADANAQEDSDDAARSEVDAAKPASDGEPAGESHESDSGDDLPPLQHSLLGAARPSVRRPAGSGVSSGCQPGHQANVRGASDQAPSPAAKVGKESRTSAPASAKAAKPGVSAPASPPPITKKSAGRPNKFLGRDVRTVLAEAGLQTAEADIQKVMDELNSGKMQNVRFHSDSPAEFAETMQSLKKLTGEALKTSNNLDLKVSRWSGVPDEANAAVMEVRNSARALASCAGVLEAAGKKIGFPPDRIAAALEELQTVGLEALGRDSTNLAGSAP